MKEIIKKSQGRINLIGEHTDYNQGWVLPTLIPYFTEVRLKTNEKNLIQIQSSHGRKYEFMLGNEKHNDNWTDYIQGTTSVLRKKNFKIGGAEIYISSTIPEGAGLSSSAALLISLLKCFREAFLLPIKDLDLALMAQEIENEFVGARVGIMDQMVIMFGAINDAFYLDTKTLDFELIKLPDELNIFMIHSGLSHKLSSKEGYNERRSECEEINKILQVKSLREVSLEDLNKYELPIKLLKRARHIITENQRVHLFVEALKRNALDEMGKLLKESHLSLRNDFEVSTKEIDTLTTIANSHPEVYGSRLTGGGFGGSIIVFARKGHNKKLASQILEDYKKHTGQDGVFLSMS